MATNGTAGARRPFKECAEVSNFCPVEMTVLSYYPNLGSNIFFAVAFGLVVLTSGFLGTWKRTWTFMLFVTGGTILETVGMEPTRSHQTIEPPRPPAPLHPKYKSKTNTHAPSPWQPGKEN